MSFYERAVTLKSGEKSVVRGIDVDVEPDEGVYITLTLMEQLALRDATTDVVREIVARHKGRTDEETARNLFRYMVKNFPYRDDPADREFVTAPIRTLTATSPFTYRDCDDLATAYSALMTAAGIMNAFKVISWRKTNPPGLYTHVFNEIRLGGKWMPVDLVMKNEGWNNERKPVIRSERWLVGGTRGKAYEHYLNDSGNVASQVTLDWNAIAKDILTRALPKPLGNGEEPGEVLKQHAVGICMEGLKVQLAANKSKIIAGAVVGATFFMTVGALGALVVMRSKAKTARKAA